LPAITKAVIPAAGVGQRLRPFTYVVPKEMLPIRWCPAIEWVSAEAVKSGCAEIAVVTSPSKDIIERYLTTYCPDLTNKCRFSFFIQPVPIGLGHALSLARDFCAGQPFAVLLPDELIEGPEPALLQMSNVFQQFGGAVFPITRESAAQATRYGQLQLRQVGQRVFQVKAILPRTRPMRKGFVWCGVGRYLFPPSVLEHAATLLGQVRNGELDDTVIFERMWEVGESVYAVHLEGRRYDVATSKGFTAAWRCLKGKTPL